MLLETSSGHAGDESYLVSPRLRADRGGTLSFYFHMYGQTMGVLRVEVKVGGRWRTAWHKRKPSQCAPF
eukprot:COSAG01_NODE_57866_length_309_cov_1.476190_1_plen_68_part_10